MTTDGVIITVGLTLLTEALLWCCWRMRKI